MGGSGNELNDIAMVAFYCHKCLAKPGKREAKKLVFQANQQLFLMRTGALRERLLFLGEGKMSDLVFTHPETGLKLVVHEEQKEIDYSTVSSSGFSTKLGVVVLLKLTTTAGQPVTVEKEENGRIESVRVHTDVGSVLLCSTH